MAARKLGQILVDLGFITDDHLEMLVEEQAQNPGQMIGQVAQEMGLITDEQLIQALGCLLYTSPSPRDGLLSRMPSSA